MRDDEMVRAIGVVLGGGLLILTVLVASGLLLQALDQARAAAPLPTPAAVIPEVRPTTPPTPLIGAPLPCGTATIAHSDGQQVALRTAPDRQAELLAWMQPGDQVVTLCGAATFGDGSTWRQVQFSDLAGWVAVDYVVDNSR